MKKLCLMMLATVSLWVNAIQAVELTQKEKEIAERLKKQGIDLDKPDYFSRPLRDFAWDGLPKSEILLYFKHGASPFVTSNDWGCNLMADIHDFRGTAKVSSDRLRETFFEFVEDRIKNNDLDLIKKLFPTRDYLVRVYGPQKGNDLEIDVGWPCRSLLEAPLGYAKKYDKPEILQYLRNWYGSEHPKVQLARLAEQDANGSTKLHHAAYRGNLTELRSLVQLPDAAEAKKIKNKDGQTPYDIAVARGHGADILALLK